MDHGTSTAYGKGCRCAECRAGRAAYMREWHRRNPGRRGTIKRNCERCGKEFMARQQTGAYKSRGRFCSKECSGHVAGTGRRPARHLPDHPLAGPDGRVHVHRMVLYDKIGPGEHPCHWCARLVPWTRQTGRGAGVVSGLVVDHLDGSPRNNTPGNLVPSCNWCNILRGLIATWEQRTGRSIVELR